MAIKDLELPQGLKTKISLIRANLAITQRNVEAESMNNINHLIAGWAAAQDVDLTPYQLDFESLTLKPRDEPNAPPVEPTPNNIEAKI